MRLHYIGAGQYIHEDLPAGIPPMPPEDFETDNPVAIAVALESGLYVEDVQTKAQAKAEAKAEAKADAEAKAAEAEAKAAAEAAAKAEADKADSPATDTVA